MHAFVLALSVLSHAITSGSPWVGVRLAVPVQSRDVGDQLGMDAGVTLDDIHGSSGVGLDLIYHYWPASPSYQAAYDRYLRNYWSQTIDSPNWAFTSFQITPHVKVIAPIAARHRPWIRAGVGLYRLNRNLSSPNWAGSPMRILGKGRSNITVVPGWTGGVGFDLRVGPRSVVGIDVSYDHLLKENERVPEFSAYTVGTHFLFGW
jgi:hypothetical protein